jgi:cyclopropane fatty-acyl-phospholipid synthase-like methyltransferase
LSRIGVAPTARCLDLGCGGGDVTRALAGNASDGFVLGADLDETRLELARAEAALENVADAVVAAGLASPAEVKQTIKELYAFAHAEGTLMSLPRIVQSWGRRTA